MEGWTLVLSYPGVDIWTTNDPQNSHALEAQFAGGETRKTAYGVLRVSREGHEWWCLTGATPQHIMRIPKGG